VKKHAPPANLKITERGKTLKKLPDPGGGRKLGKRGACPYGGEKGGNEKEKILRGVKGDGALKRPICAVRKKKTPKRSGLTKKKP